MLNKIEGKTKISTVAFVLMLTIGALMAGIPAVIAEKTETHAGVSVQPKTIGLGESITVNGYITPPPETWRKIYEGLYFVFTKPDGTTVTEGPFATEYGPNQGAGPGLCWFTYVPDKLGDWTVKLTWDGDDTHESTESEAFKFTVQEEPLPLIPPAELPTDYWERPISAENHEWYQISGDWFYSDKTSNYNASGTSFNPYSKAPETAHILWTHQPYIGGLVGGDYGGPYGESSYYEAHYYPSPFTVHMGGKIYYVSDDGIHCLDERTGEELWKPAVSIPGTSGGGTSMSYAAILWGVPESTTYANRETPQAALTTPVLWTISGRQTAEMVAGMEAKIFANAITKYDASRGTVLMILTPPPNQTFGTTFFDIHEHYAYTQMSVVYPNGTSGTRMVKWDTIGTQRNFTQRIIWDVPVPAKWYWCMGMGGGVLVSAHGWGATPAGLTAIDATTGELLWDNHPLGDYVLNCVGCIAYGKIFYPDSLYRTTHAFDLYTGEEIWTSEPREYPWGAFTAYIAAAAYDKVYIQSFDGYLYAHDANTGKIVWKFYSGDTAETTYGTWPFWSGIAIADGKVYAGTSEHSPTPPFMKGCKLYCLDANTGDEIWSIAFANGGDKSIADGTLVATNEYDSIMYAFDKGQTAIEVSASPKIIANGATVLIEGRVTDQSPAQPGTAAIADEFMSEWMEYLHMQKPAPMDIHGVDVILQALSSNGTIIDIATVTSDGYGCFSYMWTPPDEDVYTIMAVFDGSGSYWASYGQTDLGVTAAPPEAEEPAYTGIDLVIIAAVVVVAILVIYTLYTVKKQRK